MSALALLMKYKNKVVSGSDKKNSEILKKLKSKGIIVYSNHSKNNVIGADLVVYSGAIKEDNIELVEAKRLGIKTIERGTFLGLIASLYKYVIAVAGSHGKTTTTAMIGYTLVNAKKSPTIHLGGEIDFMDGNLLIGSSNIFLTEACEYRKSFLHIKPNISIILNVEKDHMECYGTFLNLWSSFKKFSDSSKDLSIFNKSCILSTDKNYLIFSDKEDSNGNFIAKNLVEYNGCYSFDCYKNNKFYDNYSLSIIGKFNVINALATIALCDYLNIDKIILKHSLFTFNGVKRRCEKITKYKNATIYSDYAHHPTQIKSVIDSFKSFYSGEFIVCFEPHTFSRTKFLFNDFINSLSRDDIDELILLPTYPAREVYDEMGSSERLYNELLIKRKSRTYFYKTYAKLRQYLIKKSESPTLILFLGAGDIDKLANSFKNLKN